MKHYLQWIMLIVGLVTIQGSVLAQCKVAKMDRPSICEIAKHPDKYVGKKIEFFAVFSSGLMAPALLSDPDCDERVIWPSVDGDYKKYEAFIEKIDKSLKKEEDSIFESGRFLFTGTLKKNPLGGRSPIKGLLQGYSMMLESACVP